MNKLVIFVLGFCLVTSSAPSFVFSAESASDSSSQNSPLTSECKSALSRAASALKFPFWIAFGGKKRAVFSSLVLVSLSSIVPYPADQQIHTWGLVSFNKVRNSLEIEASNADQMIPLRGTDGRFTLTTAQDQATANQFTQSGANAR